MGAFKISGHGDVISHNTLTHTYIHTYTQGGVMGAFKISGRGDVISPGAAWADVLVQPTTIDLFYSLYAACRCTTLHAHIHAFFCYVCICVCVYIYIYIYIVPCCNLILVRICFISAAICIRIYTYIHTYIHAYTHTHKHMQHTALGHSLCQCLIDLAGMRGDVFTDDIIHTFIHTSHDDTIHTYIHKHAQIGNTHRWVTRFANAS
jgi:hypothetical protein